MFFVIKFCAVDPSSLSLKMKLIVLFIKHFIYGCSNVAKLLYGFYKSFIFLSKNLLFQIKLCIQNKYLYPLSKILILLKKPHSVKIFILFKQTHSVKDEFYFQFSFATNEQV